MSHSATSSSSVTNLSVSGEERNSPGCDWSVPKSELQWGCRKGDLEQRVGLEGAAAKG